MAPLWEHTVPVGNVTTYTLKDLSKDNVQVGVRAVDRDGFRSPVAFPIPSSWANHALPRRLRRRGSALTCGFPTCASAERADGAARGREFNRTKPCALGREHQMATEMQDREAAAQPSRTLDPPILAEIRDEVRAQRRESKRIQSGFAFFAATALVIALANLVAVAVKLDGTTKTVTVTAPATTSAAPAQAAAPATLAHASAVTLSEFNVAPKPAQLAGGNVTFNVSNAGTVKHEFVVIKTPKPASDLLKGGRADEAGNVGEIGGIEPDQTKTLKLSLKAGHYALICNLPGHYAAGQYADLTVK